MSITLSRKWTALDVVSPNLFQSISPLETILDKFIEPRLQLSYGKRGCSPHGLVDSITPTCGVGLSLFILSKNIMPGSPFFHAIFTIRSNAPFAFNLPTLDFVRG